jgi:hypothetical protein
MILQNCRRKMKLKDKREEKVKPLGEKIGQEN